MNLDSILATGTDATSLAPKPKDNPEKVLNAAKQFESLLVAQMMKSMQDAEGGWLGTGDDQSASAARWSASGWRVASSCQSLDPLGASWPPATASSGATPAAAGASASSSDLCASSTMTTVGALSPRA